MGRVTHRFLKASSPRSPGSLSTMSGCRRLAEDPLSTLPRTSTHSREPSSWKHRSSVTRSRLRFTPGLCKARLRVSPRSMAVPSSSCRDERPLSLEAAVGTFRSAV